MPKHNEMFELSIEDVDLIEMALRNATELLSQAQSDETDESKAHREERLRLVQDLLGRLHNQKIFYRPNQGVYIGG